MQKGKEIFALQHNSPKFTRAVCYHNEKQDRCAAETVRDPIRKGQGKGMIRTTCRIAFTTDGESLTVRLSGEIDHHAAAEVRERIDAEIHALRPRATVLDLSGIDFMDSAGLGLIMGRIALMKRLGGETVLKNPTEKVLKIVRLSGLERMMKIMREGDRDATEGE